MDYFTQKINNYRVYTNQSYQELANILQVQPSTLYAVMQRQDYSTIKKDLLNNFASLIEELRSKIGFETPWIDLFLPRLPKVAFVYYLDPFVQWYAVNDIRSIPPVLSSGKYDPEPHPSRVTLYPLGLPRFPTTWLSNSYSLFEQTPLGWERVNAIDTKTVKNTQFLAQCAQTHRLKGFDSEFKIKDY